MPLLEVDKLEISARKDDGSLNPIVKGVSFDVKQGEVVALIGESGSGKTTISLSSLGYTKPGLHFAGGKVELIGTDMITAEPDKKRLMRGEHGAGRRPARPWPAWWGRRPGTTCSRSTAPPPCPRSPTARAARPRSGL